MKKYRFLSLLILLVLLLPTGAAALEDPAPQAEAALLVDAGYDKVLYELNAHQKQYPASITKIMTAMLALEAVDRGELSLSQMITAPQGIHNGLSADGTTQNIKSGEEMSLLDLLYCVLLPSANEACNVVAHAVSGDVQGFVDLMNRRASELGMNNTHYTNTHGLHDDNHYTTAWDTWLLAREAMKNKTFREIVSTKEYYVPATNLSAERHFYSTNALLTQLKYSGYVYQPAFGIKTGTTPEAGLCLVSAAQVEDRTLYCVVLGAELAHQPDNSYKRMNFAETIRLFDWGFDNFSYRTITESQDPVAQVEVTLSDTDHVLVRPEGSLGALLPNDMDLSSFTQTVTLHSESIEAPVSEGQVLGQVSLSYDGVDYGTLDLVALNDVERSDLLFYIDRTEKFFAQTWVKAAIVALLVLIVILVVTISRRGKRRRRYSRGSVYSSGYRGRRRR